MATAVATVATVALRRSFVAPANECRCTITERQMWRGENTILSSSVFGAVACFFSVIDRLTDQLIDTGCVLLHHASGRNE